MQKFLKITVFFLCWSTFGACSTHYQAPGLPENQGAYLSTAQGVEVLKVNGNNLSGKRSLALPEGEHTARLRYEVLTTGAANLPIAYERDITFEVMEGEKYSIEGGRDHSAHHYIWIEDTNSQEVVGGKKPITLVEYK